MAKLKFRPLGVKVMVRPLEVEEKSPGGIIIPDNAKEKPVRGEVMFVGPGHLLQSGKFVGIGVEPGETVLYSKYAGGQVEIGGEKLLVLDEADLLGVIEEG